MPCCFLPRYISLEAANYRMTCFNDNKEDSFHDWDEAKGAIAHILFTAHN